MCPHCTRLVLTALLRVCDCVCVRSTCVHVYLSLDGAVCVVLEKAPPAGPRRPRPRPRARRRAPPAAARAPRRMMIHAVQKRHYKFVSARRHCYLLTLVWKRAVRNTRSFVYLHFIDSAPPRRPPRPRRRWRRSPRPRRRGSRAPRQRRGSRAASPPHRGAAPGG